MALQSTAMDVSLGPLKACNKYDLTSGQLYYKQDQGKMEEGLI